MIEIWTDGSCLKNPGGTGGWAVLIARDGKIVSEFHGAELASTNNSMELTAAIMGLAVVTEQSPIVVSDSRYVVEGGTPQGRRLMRRRRCRECGCTDRRACTRNVGLPMPQVCSWTEPDLVLRMRDGRRGCWMGPAASSRNRRRADRPRAAPHHRLLKVTRRRRR